MVVEDTINKLAMILLRRAVRDRYSGDWVEWRIGNLDRTFGSRTTHTTECRRRADAHEGGNMTAPTNDPRFWAKVRQVGSDNLASCWEWTGGKSPGGYGQKNSAALGMRYAHRLAWEEFFGPIPEGLVIDHLCRNRACCNPYHLQPVTLAVNSRRRKGARLDERGELTHCVNGHEFSPANRYVSPKGWVGCRTCRRAAVYRHKSKASA